MSLHSVSRSSSSPRIRGLTFLLFSTEDSHDATCCMAVLKQWPEYDWVDMSVSCLPTSSIEESIQRAFNEQAENENKGISPPSGLCVFRRRKLVMKVGMTMEEMTQSVVYQAAAQKSLSRIGYDFESS